MIDSSASPHDSAPRRPTSWVWLVAAGLASIVALEVWLPVAPAAPHPAVAEAPISTVTLVCPSSPTFSGSTSVQVSAPDVSRLTSLPAPSNPRGRVTVTAVATDEDGAVVPRLPDPIRAVGEQLRVSAPQGAAPLLVRGTGALAPAVVASGTSLVASGDDRGMVTTTCRRPATSWWFSDASSTLGRLARIVLTNADDVPASVTVTIHDADGEVAAPGGRGIIVAPRSRVELRLDVLAPGLDTAAVRVRATTGRIHAALLMREVDVTTPRGVEWLTPTNAMDAQVIPLPSRLQSANLTLLSVDKDATASIWVRDAESRYLPPGFDRVELPAGRVVSLAIDDVIPGGVTLEITATAPIVASVRARVEPVRGSRGDIVSVGPAPALTQAALMAGLRVQDRHTVAITGVDGPATARLSILAAGIEPIVETINVTSTSQVVRDLVIPDGVGVVTVLLEPAGATASSGRIAASLVSTARLPDGVAAAGRVFVARQNTVTVPVIVPAVGMR